jgi:hypothetical protein
MIDWSLLFAGPENSGVYSVKKNALPDIKNAAAKTNLSLFVLDLSDVNGKASFLDTTARVMQFPPYFGHNWDALEDCLTDLSWLHADGFVLLIENCESFIHSAPVEMATARSILDEAAAFWKDKTVRFFAAFAEEK